MSTSERRLHRRVNLAGVTARIKADGSGRWSSDRVALLDLSLDGVRWAGDSWPRDQRVRISIRDRRKFAFSRSLTLEALIVRHDARETAARFVDVKDRERLERYLLGVEASIGQPRGEAVDTDALVALRLLGIGLQPVSGTRVAAINSARSADGKSFVASGIASAMTAIGRRVLVVDGDLRSPSQHQRFQVQGSPGLAQLLLDPTVARASEMIQVSSSGVAVLPAGVVGPVSRVFSEDKISQLSLTLRELGYPLVVIDSRPLLSSAETLLLNRIADVSLLTVRAGVTRERDVQQAIELLQRNQTPAAGVVLNDYDDPFGHLRGPSDPGPERLVAADLPDLLRDAARLSDSPAPASVRQAALSHD